MKLPNMLFPTSFLFFLLLNVYTTTADDDAAIAVPDEFLHACTEGPVDAVATALEAHPDWVHGRSSNGETCLHVAGIRGQTEITALLLQKGGDPNVRTTFDQGLRMHPLSWNVYGGHVETIRVLLEHPDHNVNADYDTKNSKTGEMIRITALDMVNDYLLPDEETSETREKFKRYYEVRDLLLKYGAKHYRDLESSDGGDEL